MDPQLDEPDLRSYLGVLNRRKWWVVGAAILVLGMAVGFSLLAEPVYEAKATVQTMGLNDPVAVVTGQDRGGLDGERLAQGELAYLRGTTLRFDAMDAVPPDTDPAAIARIKVTPILAADINQTSSVVELSLTSSDPDEAALLLRVFAITYVEERINDHQVQLIAAIAAITAEIDKLNEDIAELNAPILALEDQIVEARVAGDDGLATALEQQLDRERDQRSGAIGKKYGLISKYEADIDTQRFGLGFTNGSGATILAGARASETPISPNLPKNLTIGLVFGLILGAAAAFMREYFDDSLTSKDMLERATGVPTLGLIPRFDTAESELVTAAFPTANAAEAFRSLRTSVKFLSVDREVRVVQVTSPSPGEGKTVIAANLACAFAQAGDRVVLVGGDLRRPRAEEILGVPLTPGLTGVLIGETSLPQAIRPVDGLPNLSVLPAGYPPPNPSELLSGERARRLVDVLAQTYDLVVIDCPPVLPVTDALVLARMADTTLLVTSANKTSRRELDRTVELLQQVGAPLVGTVLTSLSRDATYGHEQPYGYESASPRQKGYDGYQATIGGYGNLADTGQMSPPTATVDPPMPAGLPVPAADHDGWRPDPPGS